MNAPHDDDSFARRARAEFDAAVDGLDAGAANRLRLARRAALAGPAGTPRLFAPLAGAIALALAAWWAWPRWFAEAPAPGPAPVASTPAPVPTPQRAAPAVPAPVPLPVAPPVASPVLPSATPSPEAIADEPAAPADDALPEEEDWDDYNEGDAELYAWLAEAPVAPEEQGGAL
jgi:hypothetical protein